MKLSFRPNPVLVYLSNRKTEIGIADLGTVLGLWLLSIFFIVIMLHGSAPIYGFICPFLIIAIPAYCAIAFVPPIASTFAFLSVSRLAKTQPYELLFLSNVSNRDLLWSCVLNILLRLQYLLVLTIGFLPFAIVIENVPGRGNCSSASAYGYCDSVEITSTVENALWNLQVFTASLGSTVYVTNIILLAILTGTMASYLREPLLAIWFSIIFFIIGVLMGIAGIPKFMWYAWTSGPTHFTEVVFVSILVAAIPIVLVVGLQHIGQHLVRRPA